MTNGRRPIILVALLAFVGLSSPGRALATKKVYSPIVEFGELELEARGSYDVDKSTSRDGAQVQKYAIGYGVTPHWFVEMYGEVEKDPGDKYQFTSLEWESRYQLFEQGERWLDAGLYFAYEATLEDGHADQAEAKLLLQKETGRFLHLANVILEKQLGANAEEGTEAGLAWSTRYRLRPAFEPAIEIHSDFGEIAGFESYAKQQHFVGPVFYGHVARYIKYDIGYLFGISNAAADGMLKWILEYEFRF
jgi:hypothetical protein